MDFQENNGYNAGVLQIIKRTISGIRKSREIIWRVRVVMPTLNWIGRKAVENHHRQVPFHLLQEVPDLSVGDPRSACRGMRIGRGPR